MNDQILDEARTIMASFLKKRREDLGLSQAELGDLCGMARSTVERIENGKFWPVMKQYLLMCQHLKLFPLVATFEEESDIAEAMRSTWVNSPSISL